MTMHATLHAFYIGFDKIRQKQLMEVLRREVEKPEGPEPYRNPPY
ncbi:MAG: hypothetical protein V3W28_08520 [Thermoplasmata archaeon]